MSAEVTETPHDPELIWVAITEAAQDHRDADLAEIAFSLYRQLADARAEIGRLKTTLRSALQALAPGRLGGWTLPSQCPPIMAASPRRTPS